MSEPDVERVFSPKIVNWIIAIFVGIILPLFLQDHVAILIGNLSISPELVNQEIIMIDTKTVAFSTIALSLIALGYTISIAYQIRFLATLKTHGATFALVITLIAPAFIWLALPFSLQAWYS